MSISLKDPRFDDKAISKEEIKQEIAELMETHHKKTSLCTKCEESQRFFDWPLCWECLSEFLTQGPDIFNSWSLVVAHRGNFENTSFVGAQFNFDDMKQELIKKTFNNCDLTGASFTNVDFSHCHFEYVDMTGVSFKNCIFRRTSFESCILRYTKFEGCDFSKSKMLTLKLLVCVFKAKTIFSDCRFDNTELLHTTFDDCVLRSTEFVGESSVIGDIFSNCDLTNCDFTCAKIHSLLIEEGSKVTDLRLKKSQKENIQFSPDIDQDRIIYVLVPRRSSKPVFWPRVCIHDIRLGISNSIEVALNCIAIGSVAGITYCVVSGAFQKEEFPLLSFLLPMGICSILLMIPGLYASMHLAEIDRKQLETGE